MLFAMVPAHTEEPAGHLLPSPYLRKRAILARIKVDPERLLVGVDQFRFHARQIFGGQRSPGIEKWEEPEVGIARGASPCSYYSGQAPGRCDPGNILRRRSSSSRARMSFEFL
jgi:hypothetical protein